jgi:hypothetical protein
MHAKGLHNMIHNCNKYYVDQFKRQTTILRFSDSNDELEA